MSEAYNTSAWLFPQKSDQTEQHLPNGFYVIEYCILNLIIQSPGQNQLSLSFGKRAKCNMEKLYKFFPGASRCSLCNIARNRYSRAPELRDKAKLFFFRKPGSQRIYAFCKVQSLLPCIQILMRLDRFVLLLHAAVTFFVSLCRLLFTHDLLRSLWLRRGLLRRNTMPCLR